MTKPHKIASTENQSNFELVIEPRKGFQIVDLRELVAYRDLFRFLIWRQIKVRYAQSAIGIGWAIIQPLFQMVIFTIIFGSLAKIDSKGTPYALFSLAALLPWTYFSNSITDGVASLVSEANMIKKIYFPRLLLPVSAVVAKSIDFGIAAVMMAIIMAIYQQLPSSQIIFLPLAVVVMVVAAAGVSIWLTALAVQYRDVKHAMNFVVQMGMYASPVVYSTDLIPDQWKLAYALNPMVGVIETFRSAILGVNPMPWQLLIVGALSSLAIFISGTLFFKAREKNFADVA
ncbi:ABC transporter permease [Rhodopirellula sp.]|nr:ABC transporter permease [Rhodopirellula sp.]